MKILGLDIETVGNHGPRLEQWIETQQEYKLGNVKDPEKIKAKLEEKKEELRRKAGLTWWTGKIVSVAVVSKDSTYKFSGHNEQQILRELSNFFSGLDSHETHELWAKSGDIFDFPFLRGRYMANQLAIPSILKGRELHEVDHIFGKSQASGQRGKLDEYAFGLGLDLKPMHGSEVQGLYDQILHAELSNNIDEAIGLWEKLTSYNAHDASIVYNIACMYRGNYADTIK